MGRPVWTSTMLGLQLSPILLLLAVSLTSAQNYKCVTEDNEDCRCIFPFKYEGVSYTECTDVDSDSLWCATSLNDNGEYLTYGFCKENEAAEVDVCAGQCQKANEECRVEGGKAVCRCLDGYIDENNDGNCKCVRDWVSGGTRGDICNTCPRGFQLKTWQHKTTKKRKQWCHREATECNPDSGELNENYPNVQRIGQGYNILIGNLLELPALDSLGHNGFRELHKRIFNPYSVNYDDSRDDCKINGYILDKSRNCRATLKTTVFSNSNQVIEKIAEKVKTGETVEEFTFSVSEGENAQFSNSVSFGAGFSQRRCQVRQHRGRKGNRSNGELKNQQFHQGLHIRLWLLQVRKQQRLDDQQRQHHQHCEQPKEHLHQHLQRGQPVQHRHSRPGKQKGPEQ